ncbi:electron transport complex subunit RsxC [Shewanella sp. AS1]|uniref:electron transport complex subunit RsxC n=1 Tax=Shewanella sp. AS1 TaxID=2907626 RepID=UPI001F16B259|nr:electron transport complex subunit RsxC [Shewanella sp. AS1]MCE9678781.1 electron transport complex subunit RsxC [Shewanella sp. AS1]
MLTLFERIDKGTLWPIPGGIHPAECKSSSAHAAIKHLPLADRYLVPVPHVGDNCTLAVQVGSKVDKGQRLTEGDNFRHLPVHAPVSGTVIAIESHASNHASGLPVLSCVIENDHQERWIDTLHEPLSREAVQALSTQTVLDKIQDAGIAGLGGAAFPTHIKLNPVSEIELLVINGVECEPYITSDDRLMQEHSDEIFRGIEIIQQLLSPKRIIIAIEDNKPQALERMRHALNRSALPADTVRVTSIPTLYPSGGEKQLIQILTGQEVPSGAIPANLGILVQNVATAFSIEQAVYCNRPLIERVVTLTGNHIAKPGNYWLPIGTPVEHLLAQAGFSGNEKSPVIIGGPMMGYMLPDRAAPLLKGTNCILAPNSEEMAPESVEKPCIRCAECAQVCPAQLLPQQLFWHAKAEEYDKAASYNLRDCIECGCCSYVCPSDIPLVEYYRIAKSALREEALEKKQAELAKQRFDSRTLRLEEEKRAREEKAKQAAQKRQAAMSGNDKDAVAAAMARIKAKKALQAETPVDNATEQAVKAPAGVANQQDKVAAAIARAKAKKAAAQQAEPSTQEATQETTPAAPQAAEPTEQAKPLTQADKVAAAIARAKAKKAAKQNNAQTPDEDEAANIAASPGTESKQDKIAAAIARAKAKKAAQQGKTLDATEEHKIEKEAESQRMASQDQSSLNAAQEKQAKIAAAIAKAKAKKAAKQQDAGDLSATTRDNEQAGDKKKAGEAESSVEAASDTPVTVQAPDNTKSLSAEELKKQRIAAAVAKAKAKKQAKAAEQTEQKDH